MQDYGVNLICVEDGIDSSKDSGKLMISVLSAVAEIERENILVQTMEGRKQKAREGKWNGGFAPYGYELVDGELKIAEDEAEIIRIIYDKFIHTTMGAGTVAKYLNRQGYIKKKRQNGTLDAFTAHFVKLVLDNPIYCGKIAFGRRKTEKIQGSRNEYHVVKQEEYPIYDGIHDAIISEEDWLLAQDKRKKTGIKNEKIYSTEHQHLLTGIIKCPICGAGLYGSVNRKRKKDGSFYRDYWYYACKHRLEYDGHKCTFKKQIHQEKINEAVVEVIRNIVKNSKFDSAIKEKLDASVDLSKYEKEEAYLMTQIRQLTAAKERLGSQIDRLDCSDRHYEQKFCDMQNRINSLYDEIAEATENLETIQTQIKAIKEQKISRKRIFEFLELFDIIYNEFTEFEKKEFLHSFIKKIEIYPEPLENGQILKSIQFRFPVYYQGNEADMFIPNFENTVETVVLLEKEWRAGGVLMESSCHIRKLRHEEVDKALSLVWKVFQEYEAPDYTEDGVEEFYKSIHDESYLSMLCLYGAFIREELVGIIATRSEGTHVALFFVDGKYHRQGIGKMLFQAARSANTTGKMTVNSSPYAVCVYHKLGFKDTDTEQVVNSLRFTPMVWNEKEVQT